MGNALKVHGLVILLALTAGTILAGIVGAVLAVPLAAVAWAVIKVCTGEGSGDPAPAEGEPERELELEPVP
jgi:predicted PurR-regulated permease PerM